jgi:hypothetical protein
MRWEFESTMPSNFEELGRLLSEEQQLRDECVHLLSERNSLGRESGRRQREAVRLQETVVGSRAIARIS